MILSLKPIYERIFSPKSILYLGCSISLICIALAPALLEDITLTSLSPTHIIIYGILAFLALLLFDDTQKKKTEEIALSLILSIFFTLFVTIGNSVTISQDWGLCFLDIKHVSIWLIQCIVYGYIFYKIILGIIVKINNCLKIDPHSSNIEVRKIFLLLVSIKLIYFVAFYPCVFGFDAAVGLRTFLDSESATCNHHPYVIQLLHAYSFILGKKIGHISIGFAILSLLLIVASSIVCCYGVSLLKKSGLERKMTLIITWILILFPLYPYLSVYPTKDGIFAYSFLLYVLSLYELQLSRGENLKNRRFKLIHVTAIILICITRHQGFYITIIEMIALLWLYCKKEVLSLYLLPLCLVACYSKILLPALNVEETGKQEMYGTLFQQTALYIKKHPNDISKEERKAIDNILPFDSLANKYTYNITDPVKNLYYYNPWYRETPNSLSMFRHIDRTGEQKALKEYLSAWFSMFLRHPITYLEASVYVCIGFFYNLGQPLIYTEPKWGENSSATTPEYNFWHINYFARLHSNFVYNYIKKPIFSWGLSVTYYNWLSLLFAGILIIRRNKYNIVTYLPFLLSIGLLVICPISYGRYAFPIIIVLPFLFALLLATNHNEHVENSSLNPLL